MQRAESGRGGGSVAVRPQRPAYGYTEKRHDQQQDHDEATSAFRPTSDIDSYLSSENDYYKAWQVQRPPPPAFAATAAAASNVTYPLTSYVLPVGVERSGAAAVDEQTEHFIDHVYESPKFHKKESV